MLPPSARVISPQWFRVLSLLMFVRYNFNHFRVSHPGLVDADPLMAQRLETMEMLLQAIGNDDDTSLNHLSPLFELFLD